MKPFYILCLLAGSILAVATELPGAEFDFTADGQIAIVVPGHPLKALDTRGIPTRSQTDAARLLQMLIERASGIRLSVVQAGASTSATSKIFVGFGPHLKGRVAPPNQPGGIKITEDRGDLFLLGEIAAAGTNNWPDPVDRGVQYAVERFAEEVMGYRFLFSNPDNPPKWYEIGTVIPKLNKLTIKTGLNIEEAPAFQHRTTHGGYLNYIGLQTGGSVAFNANHTHDVPVWKELYGDEHPELFVAVGSGHRNWKHLDYAEPLVLQKELEHLESYFRTGENTGFARPPTSRYILAVPTDTYAWPGTHSEAAKALLRPATGYWGSNMVVSDSGCYSDIVFDYVRRLGLEVGERWPHMRVSALAYQWHTQTPNFELPDNVDVMLCLMRSTLQSKQPEVFDFNLGLVKDWSAKLNHDRNRLFLWEYFCWPSMNVTPPIIAPHAIQRWLKTVEPYASGVFINGMGNASPFDYLMYRLWMRLLWNPDLDVDAEIEDLCNRFYGPAGETMHAFYDRLIRRYEMTWEDPTLVFNQYYVTPDLYYGQSYPEEEIRWLAGRLEKARKEAGLPASLEARVGHGAAMYVLNIEDDPQEVLMTLTAPAGADLIQPRVAWDNGRTVYRGTLHPGEQLTITDGGRTATLRDLHGARRTVELELHGSPAVLEPGGADVFHFWQKGPLTVFSAKLSYGPPPPRGDREDEIYAKRLAWLRQPYLVFHPCLTYGGKQNFTGFFVEAHVAHKHLGAAPSYEVQRVETLPTDPSDPAWKETATTDLVRGRKTPWRKAGDWSYMTENNVLPLNNLGFPADRATKLRSLYSEKGIALHLEAEGEPVEGETLEVNIASRRFRVLIRADSKPDPSLSTKLHVTNRGWQALLSLNWSTIGGFPQPAEKQAPALDLQVIRERGQDSYVWSPPLGSIWGHQQQGPGKLILTDYAQKAAYHDERDDYRIVNRWRITSGPPRHRAFPGLLRLKNGKLLLTYKEGTGHWNVGDLPVVRTSRDDGQTWSEPMPLMTSDNAWALGAHHGAAEMSDGSIVIPAMGLRGRVLPGLGSQPVGKDIGKTKTRLPPVEWRAFAIISRDGGTTWAQQQIGPMPGWIWQNTYGRVMEVHGEWWLPGGGAKEGDPGWPFMRSGFFVSRDRGKTWPEWRTVSRGLQDEKDMVELPDGRLLSMIRSGANVYRSYSRDRGQTWDDPVGLDIHGQSPCLSRLRDGRLLFAYRQVRPEFPIGVGLAISHNDGMTWQELESLYETPKDSLKLGGRIGLDCAYPSMVQLPGGDVLVAYYTATRGDPVESHIELVRLKLVN